MPDNLNYTFKILARDWHKRRKPNPKTREPLSVEIPHFKREHNHMCTMVVTYSDNSKKELIARVIYNQLAQRWTVDGMEVAVEVLEC
ncbi:hypothetical protein DXX93_11415 [Thalassotalea euphylliae]|uniref:Uncharacterized protein n=1 Tax=Thalassotalea euphylliae TaxID=1655234 RepID=A0A3E0TRJ2_9GAMM|nr:hypothetical protein [Thalassotalea euphylliae]REL27114.1 hypothetical protein DXX93_11415 [Thalassotalea euphylliae]